MLKKTLKKMEVIHGFIHIPAGKKTELLGNYTPPFHTKLNDSPPRVDVYGRIWSDFLKNKFPVDTEVTVDRYEDGFKVISNCERAADSVTNISERNARQNITDSSHNSFKQSGMDIVPPNLSQLIQKNSKTKRMQLTLEGLPSKEDWAFAKGDTGYLTHKIHDYPARMIPQIAQRLIDRYSPAQGKILDPFCGSGTTLVED